SSASRRACSSAAGCCAAGGCVSEGWLQAERRGAPAMTVRIAIFGNAMHRADLGCLPGIAGLFSGFHARSLPFQGPCASPVEYVPKLRNGQKLADRAFTGADDAQGDGSITCRSPPRCAEAALNAPER